MKRSKYIAPFKKRVNPKTTLKQHLALERAWKNRDFEIELYWKRANYFWAFIATAFAGYFLFISADNSAEEYPNIDIVITGLGLIFSLGWFLVNLGSKKWQENWEKHIDLLGNDITGPIYKTVIDKTAPSVSGVNLKISLFVVLVWVYLLLRKYLVYLGHEAIVFWVLFIFFLLILLKAHVKVLRVFGYKKDQSFSFIRRRPPYKDKEK